LLQIKDLSFSYPSNTPVFAGLNLDLQKGERLAVMGPSGCGKSTLLSLIGGLLKPTSGSITNHFQKIAFVFQEPRLFPWLTVRENLETVLNSKADVGRIHEALEAVGLVDCEELFPEELSGGMKSRVSLARAMLYGGDLFLLDEPFAALDEALRRDLIGQLKVYLSQNEAAAIFVTHQKEDAEAFANRCFMLSPREKTESL